MAAVYVYDSPRAEMVGKAFVSQYYNIWSQIPYQVYLFYKDNSKLRLPGDNAVMSIATTVDEIKKKTLDFGRFSSDIKTVDVQESENEGFFIVVTGYLTRNEITWKKFSQSFFLAPLEECGYYVLNDVLNYVNDSNHENGCHTWENNVTKIVANVDASHSPEPPADGIRDGSQEVADSNNCKTEQVQDNKSYASIVKRGSSVPTSTAAPPASETVVSSTSASENGNNPVAETSECENHSWVLL